MRVAKLQSIRNSSSYCVALRVCVPQHARSIGLDENVVLSFLSIVNVSLIPLCLITGPSINIDVDDGESKRWLLESVSHKSIEHIGADQDIEWRDDTRQSDCGILLRVGTQNGASTPAAVTELLIYAAVESGKVALPTPPTSSSPIRTSVEGDSATSTSQLPIVRFYALPLCSNNLKRAQEASGLCTPPPDGGEAFFIPDDASDLEVAVRRRKISGVFDAATKERRKTKAKGGESIAKAMANLERSQTVSGRTQSDKRLGDSVPPPSRDGKPPKSIFSRASSDASFILSQEPSKPPSRPSTAIGKQRSSLHRVESAYDVREDSAISDTNNDVLEQNKTALSKIIMAGMRLHGLQQRKKPDRGEVQPARSRSISQVDGHTSAADEDEYKLVYHQTLKAAIFAFRSHCNTKVISQDAMRDVVDRLLDLFCTDPLSPAPISDGFTPALTTACHEKGNPFDAPSSSATRADEIKVWNTPVHKKRKMHNDAESG